MVEKYLEKLYQELYEKKINLDQEVQKKEVELNNNIRFIQTLEKTLDEDFESFTPRKVDEESHKKIQFLTKEQKEIREDIDSLQLKISKYNLRIEELEEVLEDFRKNQGYTEVPSNSDDFSSEQYVSEYNINNIIEYVIPDLSSVMHKVQICNKLISVDPIRCKLELREIEKIAENTIHKLEKFLGYDE